MMPPFSRLRALLFAALALLPLLAVMVVYGCSRSSPSHEQSNAAAPGGAAAPMAMATAAAESKASADEKPTSKGAVATWKRSQLASNVARLAIGDKAELPLVGMQMNVKVEGFRARVVLDYYFANQGSGTYEGTFQLRLPNEASPYFFAFGQTTVKTGEPPPYFKAGAAAKLGVEPASILTDRAVTWTEPKEARMVPREKAALAYEQTVARRVDPGLMEWSGAGVFSARVFPLGPGMIHRIVIGYDADLVPAGDDLEYSLDVPENAPGAVVDLSVLAPQGAAVAVSPEAPAAAGEGKSHYRFVAPKEHTITVRLKKPGPTVLQGSGARTGAYFAASLRPDLGAAEPVKAGAGDAAVFAVDTSLSGNPDKFNVWLKLMQAILDNNRDTMKRFAVVFFNVEALWYRPAFVDNTPDNVAALLTFARGLSLEGATDLGAALGQAARPPWLAAGASAKDPWDVFLLSDGASTWGEADRFALSRALSAGDARALYAYQTGMAGTDTGLLAHLTRESGGALFSVVGEAEVVKASTAHRSRPWQITGVEVPGGSDLLLAGRPRSIFPGQTLLLVGRGVPEKGAEVVLNLTRDGKPRAVRVKLGQPLSSPLAGRAYGQVAVAQMEEFDAATEALATSYAVYFRVTGKTCSLLMLESEADYQRYNIKPDDPAAIEQSLASAAIARAQKTIGDALGDPRAGFLAWLDKLQRTPGMKLVVPQSLRDVLQSMPAARFIVEAPPLDTKMHEAKAVPGAYSELLSIHKLEYDAATVEAERRLKASGPADALKALSSLVEENPGDSVLARDVAFSAMQWGLGGQAYHLFHRVAAQRPYEPQSYRAMASCLVDLKQIDLAIAYYEVGLLGEWNARFGDFQRILGLEYVHLLRRIAAGELTTGIKDYAMSRLSTLAAQFSPAKADVVVMITWNTDSTDVDLHVIEPSGEECYYAHRKTAMGGELTADVTQGFGPEMYVLPGAASGTYQIKAHYFASDRNRAGARTKVQAVVFEGWGTAREKVTEKVVTLELGKDTHDIATVVKKAL